ncbi:MAG: hypothetical protein F3739_08760 [Nitrospinae bacterium]|nr:hypothetical protein [Nitrospinota bacterium]
MQKPKWHTKLHSFIGKFPFKPGLGQNLEKLEVLNFLQVYIPSGRRERLKIPWLNNYILRSLKIRANVQENKVTS